MKLKATGLKRDLIPLLQAFTNQFGHSSVSIFFTEYWKFAAATDSVSVNIDLPEKAEMQVEIKKCMCSFSSRDNYTIEICDSGTKIKSNEILHRKEANVVKETYQYDSVRLNAFDDLELYEEKLKGNFND